MKAISILDKLIACGTDMTNCGLAVTDNTTDHHEWMWQMFRGIITVGTIQPDTMYLYAYDDLEDIADVSILLDDSSSVVHLVAIDG